MKGNIFKFWNQAHLQGIYLSLRGPCTFAIRSRLALSICDGFTPSNPNLHVRASLPAFPRLTSDDPVPAGASVGVTPAAAYRAAMASAGAATAGARGGGGGESQETVGALERPHPQASGAPDMEDSIMRGPTGRKQTRAEDGYEELANKFKCVRRMFFSKSKAVVLRQEPICRNNRPCAPRLAGSNPTKAC